MKQQTTTTSVKTAKTNSAIVNVNLSAFTDKLKNVEVKEKKTRDTIYIYPENFTPKMIGEEIGKKFRNKLRTKIKFFENNIFVFAKTNNAEKLTETVKEFNEFYKANYRINDFSVNSISQSSNELKANEIILMLDIVKAVNAANSPKETPKNAIVKTAKK